jgi:SAM-dependent methyltransferase
MSDVPDKSTFASLYSAQAPWDLGKPHKAFIDVADQIAGSILNASCGTRKNALFFAIWGRKVTAIDVLADITRVRKKAAERRVTATFFVIDALVLKDLPEIFDSVIDSGFFHVFNDQDRPK